MEKENEELRQNLMKSAMVGKQLLTENMELKERAAEDEQKVYNGYFPAYFIISKDNVTSKPTLVFIESFFDSVSESE